MGCKPAAPGCSRLWTSACSVALQAAGCDASRGQTVVAWQWSRSCGRNVRDGATGAAGVACSSEAVWYEALERASREYQAAAVETEDNTGRLTAHAWIVSAAAGTRRHSAGSHGEGAKIDRKRVRIGAAGVKLGVRMGDSASTKRRSARGRCCSSARQRLAVAACAASSRI